MIGASPPPHAVEGPLYKPVDPSEDDGANIMAAARILAAAAERALDYDSTGDHRMLVALRGHLVAAVRTIQKIDNKATRILEKEIRKHGKIIRRATKPY